MSLNKGCLFQGQTALDLADADLEPLLEELREKQELVSGICCEKHKLVIAMLWIFKMNLVYLSQSHCDLQ